MKKNYLVVLMCMVMVMMTMLSACGSNKATAESEQNLAAEETVEAIPLTQNSDYEGGVSTSFLKTQEGIVISCSDNYTLGHEIHGQFWFNISYEEFESEEFLKPDYDWSFELTSNAKIVKVEFYDYEDVLIGSEEPKNNIIVIDQDYKGVYVDSFVLYIEEDGTLYRAHFGRTGM